MKKTGLAILMASIACSSVAEAASTEDRLKQLERDAKRAKAKIKSLNKKADKVSDRIKVNGFFSTGVATTTKKGLNYNNVVNEENTQYDSIIGIQTTYQVDDKTDLTAQFVAKGEEGFNLVSDWAFISHRLTNNLTVRAGRLRLPFYMYSESLEVGVSYPWARPPCEVYCSTPLDAYEGVDALYTFNTGNWKHTVQAYVGVGTTEDHDSTLVVNDSYGLNVTTQYEDLTVRLGHAIGNVVAKGKAGSEFESLSTALKGVGLPVVETPTPASFSGFGVKYEGGSVFAAAEYTNLKIEDNFFPDYESQFVSLGYRIGSVMPYITHAQVSTQKKGDDLRDEYAAKLNAAVAQAEAGATAATNGAASASGGAATATAAAAAMQTRIDTASTIAGDSVQAVNALKLQAIDLNAQAASLTAQAKGATTTATGLKSAAQGILGSSREHKSISAGVRWDYSARVAVKVQVDRLYDMNEKSKAGPGIDNNGVEAGYVYSLVIDTAF